MCARAGDNLRTNGGFDDVSSLLSPLLPPPLFPSSFLHLRVGGECKGSGGVGGRVSVGQNDEFVIVEEEDPAGDADIPVQAVLIYEKFAEGVDQLT